MISRIRSTRSAIRLPLVQLLASPHRGCIRTWTKFKIVESSWPVDNLRILLLCFEFLFLLPGHLNVDAFLVVAQVVPAPGQFWDDSLGIGRLQVEAHFGPLFFAEESVGAARPLQHLFVLLLHGAAQGRHKAMTENSVFVGAKFKRLYSLRRADCNWFEFEFSLLENNSRFKNRSRLLWNVIVVNIAQKQTMRFGDSNNMNF